MSYTAKDIIKLDDIQAVRKNPGMFIGSTETPIHLLNEVLDNALDEVQAGYCDRVEVELDNNKNYFSVTDNGRGFPFDETLPLNEDAPVMACKQLATSGKFNKGEKGPYLIASGLHGVGLTAVNALSDKLIIEIYRDGKYAKYTFTNAIHVTRSVKQYKGMKPFSTKVTVYPKKRYFTKLEIDSKEIEKRLQVAKIEHNNVAFILNNKEINTTVDELLKQINPDIETDEWIYLSHENKRTKEKYECYISWNFSSSLSPKTFSTVNLIPTHQGVHINKVYNAIRDVLYEPNKNYLQRDDVVLGLRLVLFLKIVKSAFDAQVKIRLTGNSDISILNTLPNKLKEYFKSHDELYSQLIEHFKEIRKQKNAQQAKKQIKHKSIKFTRLKDCLQPGLQSELLIGEGESAVSSLQTTRDVKTQAILPLRGVVANSITMNPDKLLKNDVVKDLIQAVGTGIAPDCDISKIRYGKIIIATDADPAGRFIASLLVMMFVKLMPCVIQNGHLYLAKTPLYGIGKNQTFKPVWTKEEVKKLRNQNKTIRRFKGLGEFNPSEIYRFTFGNERRLYKVQWKPDMIQYLEELFSLSESKRVLLQQVKEAQFEEFILE